MLLSKLGVSRYKPLISRYEVSTANQHQPCFTLGSLQHRKANQRCMLIILIRHVATELDTNELQILLASLEAGLVKA